MRYNDNIEILKEKVIGLKSPLEKDEWFALMVIDREIELTHKREDGDNRTFFNFSKAWLGLEQTSSKKIYISKNITKRQEYYRGDTQIVKVKDKSKCYILGENE